MSGGLWDLVLPASRTGQVPRQTECDHERQMRHDRRVNTNEKPRGSISCRRIRPPRHQDSVIIVVLRSPCVRTRIYKSNPDRSGLNVQPGTWLTFFRLRLRFSVQTFLSRSRGTGTSFPTRCPVFVCR
jgi:hypothetical protein